MTMDKDEKGLRGNLAIAKEHEDDSMRKSFRGVDDEATADEIMNSFASLVLRSDELLRMAMDGSAGKLGDGFDDDISSGYEEYEDDDEDDKDDAIPLPTDDNINKFEADLRQELMDQQLGHVVSVLGSPKPAATPSQPPVIFQRPTSMVSPLPSPRNNMPVPVSSTVASPKKETKVGATTAAATASENVKPKRPLSAYNLYFQLERERLVSIQTTSKACRSTGRRAFLMFLNRFRWFLRPFSLLQIAGVDPEQPFTAEDVKRIAIQRRELEQNPGRPKRKHRKSHGKISFAELARRIADKWKNLKPEAKDLLQERAAIEKTRYLRELEDWTKFNNTSSDGIYSPKITSSGQPGQCPKTPRPTPIYMPSQFISSPPRRADAMGGPIFQRQSYVASPISPRMPHDDPAPAFHGDSPPLSPRCMMMLPYQPQLQHQQSHNHLPGQSPQSFYQQLQQQEEEQQRLQQQHHQLQQQQQQFEQRYYHSEENYLYEQHRPTLVSPSNSFDLSFEPQMRETKSQDLTYEASALAERYGWSTSSVLEMMRELDKNRLVPTARSMTPISDDGTDDVPRGILDEVRFTPI
jgi:hypothetical protein